MYSLKKKLNKSLILSMVTVMLLLLFGLGLFIKQMVKQQILTRLQHDAESIVSVIQLTTDKNWIINPSHISTVYSRVRSGHYYVVKTAHQTIRSRSLFDYEITIPIIDAGQSVTQLIKGAGEERWLIWQQNVQKNNQQLQLWVAEDIEPFQQQLIRFFVIAVLLVMLSAVILVYWQHTILNRAFLVFDKLRNNLQAVREGEMEKTGTPVPIEILPLITEIEVLVEQLKQRIQRTRNAIGNLAHEIKRPLQVLSQQLESAKDENTATQSFMDIHNIVERELRRAKISGSMVAGGSFNITEEVPYLLEVMKKIYPNIHINLDIQNNLADIKLDRDDMLELIGNLLDNACKFAQSRVFISIQFTHQELIICIEDDGAGVEQALINKMTEKGVRLDESVQGHGLGLSICTEIIQIYHGKFNFSQAAIGGLKVQVFIPAMVQG